MQLSNVSLLSAPTSYTLGGMQISRLRVPCALAGAAALALTLAVSGCSSDSASDSASEPVVQTANGSVAPPEAPVRVGVPDFADVIASPNVTIVDVRTPEEFAQGHIEGALNIPVEYADFTDQVSQLDADGTYAVYCRSGNRSQTAVDQMSGVGINGIYELESGTNGWAAAGQPLVQ